MCDTVVEWWIRCDTDTSFYCERPNHNFIRIVSEKVDFGRYRKRSFYRVNTCYLLCFVRMFRKPTLRSSNHQIPRVRQRWKGGAPWIETRLSAILRMKSTEIISDHTPAPGNDS